MIATHGFAVVGGMSGNGFGKEEKGWSISAKPVGTWTT